MSNPSVYRGQLIVYRGLNNEVYAAHLVKLQGLEHHPLKAYVHVLMPEGSYTTVADYDPDTIKPGCWSLQTYLLVEEES